jgi:peptidoglycan/LPS O-acetylase OafA/YrhL
MFHFYSQTSEHFIGGKYGVEFYLLIAGLYFFKSYERQSSNELPTPYAYAKKRFCRFFPWMITAFITSYVVIRVIIKGAITSFENVLDYAVVDFWEIFLIKMNGVNNNKELLNGPAWTLSAMIISEFFIWGFLKYYHKQFLNFIMPVSLLIGFGYWKHIDSAHHTLWIGFTTFGVLRSYLVICMAYYCLQLSKKLRSIQFNKLGQYCLTFVECLCHVFAIWIVMCRDSRFYQWFIIIIFLIAFAISDSGHSLLAKLISKIKIVPFLGQLSFSIYLIHFTIVQYFAYLYSDVNIRYSKKYIFLITVLICSILHFFVTKFLIKFFSKLSEKVKCKLISS